MLFSVHARLGIAPNFSSQVVKELPPSPSSPGAATCFEGTNRTLFRTFADHLCGICQIGRLVPYVWSHFANEKRHISSVQFAMPICLRSKREPGPATLDLHLFRARFAVLRRKLSPEDLSPERKRPVWFERYLPLMIMQWSSFSNQIPKFLQEVAMQVFAVNNHI